METIKVKFRGDGGPEYTGPERRTKEKGRGTAESRVEKEISGAVGKAIKKDTTEPELGISYKKTPADNSRADSDEFREDVIRSAIAQIAIELAEKATVLNRIE